MWGSVGFIAAVTASGFILAGGGRRAVSAARAAACSRPARRRLPGACRASSEQRRRRRRVRSARSSVLRQPVVAWFFAGVFLTVLAHTSLYAFYSLYLASLGYGKGAIGLLWAVGVVGRGGLVLRSRGAGCIALSMHGWLVARRAGVGAALRR